MELAKAPALAAVKKPDILPKSAETKKTKTPSAKPKEKAKPKTTVKPKETKKTEKKPAATKPKAKVKIE
jgi:cell division protein FtsQ